MKPRPEDSSTSRRPETFARGRVFSGSFATALAFAIVLAVAPRPGRAETEPEPAVTTDPPAAAAAVGPSDEDRAEYERLVALDASLEYQTGLVDLGGGLATLTLPDTLRFLDPTHTERLLVEGWGNPDGAGTLGMIVPGETSPLSGDGWGVVVSYEEEGWVSDEDADSIDYDALLEEMKSGTEAENDARSQQGFGRVELVGWAERPRYEPSSHKLFWAKELAFEGSPSNTLNYNVRVLGRRGVLVLNAVASMEQIELIRGVMPAVITAAEFAPGNRYADYEPGSDRVATYGIAALVAGGIAAKSGLFGKLAVLLLAGKKLLIPGLAAVAAAVAALWRRRGAGTSGPTQPPA